MSVAPINSCSGSCSFTTTSNRRIVVVVGSVTCFFTRFITAPTFLEASTVDSLLSFNKFRRVNRSSSRNYFATSTSRRSSKTFDISRRTFVSTTTTITNIIGGAAIEKDEQQQQQQRQRNINTKIMGVVNHHNNNQTNIIDTMKSSSIKEETKMSTSQEKESALEVQTSENETSALSNPTDGDVHDGMSRPFTTAHSKAPFAVGERFWETGFAQSLDVQQPFDEPLAHMTSEYQDIRVYSNAHYGKILVLDGVVQVTERDGNAYNEMMAHVPLMSHPCPKRVLVLGGGDGYVVTEVLKHKSVEHVDHVELDSGVVEFCREHFPQWSKGFASDETRVKLHIMDGSTFVANASSESYDVIIQDSSDPYVRLEDGTIEELPSKVLFSDDHFQHCLRLLTKDGVFCMQAETFQLPDDFNNMKLWRNQILNAGFLTCRYGTMYVGSYPIGQIGLLLATRGSSEKSNNVQERYDIMTKEQDQAPTYYWPPLQESCFILPRWVHKALYEDNDVTKKEEQQK